MKTLSPGGPGGGSPASGAAPTPVSDLFGCLLTLQGIFRGTALGNLKVPISLREFAALTVADILSQSSSVHILDDLRNAVTNVTSPVPIPAGTAALDAMLKPSLLARTTLEWVAIPTRMSGLVAGTPVNLIGLYARDLAIAQGVDYSILQDVPLDLFLQMDLSVLAAGAKTSLTNAATDAATTFRRLNLRWRPTDLNFWWNQWPTTGPIGGALEAIL